MKCVIVGFTGRRDGMSRPQLREVHRILRELADGSEQWSALHGDAIGADSEFDALCRTVGIETRCRPCTLINQRAFKAKPIAEATNPMARNRAIVKDCDILIGAPPTQKEQEKGGTWNTIRMGRKANKRVVIVLPNGEIMDEAPRQEAMF